MIKNDQIKNYNSLCKQLKTLKTQLKEKEKSITKDGLAIVESRFGLFNFNKKVVHPASVLNHETNLAGNFLSGLFKKKLFKNKSFLFKLIAGFIAKRTGKHIHKKMASKINIR